MLPFYIYEYPEAARALLMYRYNLLNAARKNAEKMDIKEHNILGNQPIREKRKHRDGV